MVDDEELIQLVDGLQGGVHAAGLDRQVARLAEQDVAFDVDLAVLTGLQHLGGHGGALGRLDLGQAVDFTDGLLRPAICRLGTGRRGTLGRFGLDRRVHHGRRIGQLDDHGGGWLRDARRQRPAAHGLIVAGAPKGTAVRQQLHRAHGLRVTFQGGQHAGGCQSQDADVASCQAENGMVAVRRESGARDRALCR